MYKRLFIKESIKKYQRIGIAEFRIDSECEGFILTIGDYPGKQFMADREVIQNGSRQIWKGVPLRHIAISKLQKLTSEEADTLLTKGVVQ